MELQAGSGGLSYFRVLNEESQYGHIFRSFGITGWFELGSRQLLSKVFLLNTN